MLVASVKPQIPPKTGGFTLNLRWNAATAYRNSEYGVWLNDMKTFFERIITSNRTLNVDIYFENLGSDGPLAQCGPGDASSDNMIGNVLSFLSDLDTNNSTRTVVPKHSTMRFSTHYYKEPPITDTDRAWKRQFFTTALHECFHGCGLGSLWNGDFRITIPNPFGSGGIQVLPALFNYNVIGRGDPDNPQYWGLMHRDVIVFPPSIRYTVVTAYARAEYRSEMIGQSGVTTIPIENNRGAAGILDSNHSLYTAGGTALAHWRGIYGGGSNPSSGIKNAKGQDHYNEVFTSWSSRNEGNIRWVSRYTIGALRDIGWSVDYSPLEIALNDWRSA